MISPNWLEPVLKELVNHSIPAHSALSEEEQYAPAAFVEENPADPIEVPRNGSWVVDVERPVKDLKFEAFLDGVQRTVLWRRVPLPTGSFVPIHIAHISAGILLRDSEGRLFLDPDLIAARLLLVGPFEGIKRAGVTIKSLSSYSPELLWDTANETFAFPTRLNEWIVCDTTFQGTDVDREKQTEGVLLGDALFNEGLIRSRAQGRVATLRQRLELAVLARFRKKYPEKWVLVDGPLFFIEKWRRRAINILGSELGEENTGFLEDKLLRNAVGLIKTHRLRPKNPERIVKVGPTQRSLVFPLFREVDLKGKRDAPDEEGEYGGLHLTWYTRLRCHVEPPFGLLGLIRLDIHRASLGIVRGDALDQAAFETYHSVIDAITWAVWRERWPAFRRVDDYRSAAEPYPIQQVERVLKAMVLPRRFLASLFV